MNLFSLSSMITTIPEHIQFIDPGVQEARKLLRIVLYQTHVIICIRRGSWLSLSALAGAGLLCSRFDESSKLITFNCLQNPCTRQEELADCADVLCLVPSQNSLEACELGAASTLFSHRAPRSTCCRCHILNDALQLKGSVTS